MPRRFGGFESDFRTEIETTRELAKGCGSTAWAISLINTCSWMVGLADDRAQQDVWGENPDARVAGTFAAAGSQSRRVRDGLIVSGRWGWCSGCLHADWGLIGFPIV